MRVVITGAAGFAASHLIRLLKKQNAAELFAWVKDEKETANIQLDREHICVVDITDAERVEAALERICPDQIYHLAAQASVGLSWKLPAKTLEINALGTMYLLEGLRKYAPKARVLLVGSAEQYGRVEPDKLPIPERYSLRGDNPYSISKMTQELMAHMYAEHYGMQVIIVRAFNHIGPGQAKNFVIPDWCAQVASMERGEMEHVLKVGNIRVKRDFTDVRDIVSAYTLLMERGEAGQIYNVGSGKAHSLEEVLQKILSASTLSDIRYEVDEQKLRPADIPILEGDITKLRQATGWEPKYGLEQSIQDILEEMRKRQ